MVKIHIVKENTLHIAELIGDLGTLEIHTMPPQILPFTKKKFGTVIIDLSKTTFIDSQWLAVFIQFHEKGTRQGNVIHFLITDETIRELFFSTGLNKVFHLIESLDAVRAE